MPWPMEGTLFLIVIDAIRLTRWFLDILLLIFGSAPMKRGLVEGAHNCGQSTHGYSRHIAGPGI